MKEPKIDWSLVEPRYRAGDTLRGMADKFGISHVSIIKHAQKHGWERDEDLYQQEDLPDRSVDFAMQGGFVYVIYIETGEGAFYKIGLSSNLIQRVTAHQTSSPFEIRMALAYYVGDMRAEEKALHLLFDAQRVRGEWFTLSHKDLRTIANRCLLVAAKQPAP